MAEAKTVAPTLTPQLDIETLASMQQRNFEAFTALGARLAAGAHTLLKRQSELVQTHLNSQLSAASELLANPGSQAGLHKQIAFVQAQTKRALADSEELAGILSATATEALDILYKRTEESVS